eukprot:393801_1
MIQIMKLSMNYILNPKNWKLDICSIKWLPNCLREMFPVLPNTYHNCKIYETSSEKSLYLVVLNEDSFAFFITKPNKDTTENDEIMKINRLIVDKFPNIGITQYICDDCNEKTRIYKKENSDFVSLFGSEPNRYEKCRVCNKTMRKEMYLTVCKCGKLIICLECGVEDNNNLNNNAMTEPKSFSVYNPKKKK